MIPFSFLHMPAAADAHPVCDERGTREEVLTGELTSTCRSGVAGLAQVACSRVWLACRA